MRGNVMLLVALLAGLGAGWYAASMNPDRDQASRTDVDGSGAPFDDDDNDNGDVAVRNRLVAADGEVRIRLTPAEVKLGGIRTALPETVTAAPAARHAGRVLAAGPLLAAQAQLRAMTSEVDAQATVIAALDTRLAELTAGARLGAQRDISALQLERARALASITILRTKRDAARTALEAHWGSTLVASTAAADGPADALLDGSAALIGFNLPAGAKPPASTFTVTLAGQSLTATSMGPSPVALAGLPGRGWFGLIDDPDAGTGATPPAAGMPVAVWTEAASSTSGVLVPPSAIVWDADGRWVFLMPAPNEYVRRAVSEGIEQPGGLIVTGIAATTPVVIAGAQILQGERFRGGIPDEDED